MTHNGKNPPGTSGSHVHAVQFEHGGHDSDDSVEVLESLPLGAMFMDGLETLDIEDDSESYFSWYVEDPMWLTGTVGGLPIPDYQRGRQDPYGK